MIIETRLCRFCKKLDDPTKMVYFGLRQYAHAPCLYVARGEAGISKLWAWQISKLPVIQMSEVGLSYERICELRDAAKKRENEREQYMAAKREAERRPR